MKNILLLLLLAAVACKHTSAQSSMGNLSNLLADGYSISELKDIYTSISYSNYKKRLKKQDFEYVATFESGLTHFKKNDVVSLYLFVENDRETISEIFFHSSPQKFYRALSELEENNSFIYVGENKTKSIKKWANGGFIYYANDDKYTIGIYRDKDNEAANAGKHAGNNIVLQEDFTDNSFKWLEGETGEYKFKVSDGRYTLQSKAGGYWFSTRPVSLNTSKDFEISARIKKVSGTDGYYFGLILGYSLDTKHHHFAGITGQGNAVFANKGTAPADLIPGGTYAAVKTGNATNLLTIKKVQRKIILLVNGVQIGETTYQPFFGNYFGFALWSGNSTLKLEIDEFSIKMID